MSDLLTYDEYKAIAAGLTFPVNAFIHGKFQSPRSGQTLETINPATGEILAQIAACNSEDVDFAVRKAREAFDSGVWSKAAPAARKEVLIKLVKLINRHRHELAVLESLESGKPISECQLTDVPETASCIAWHAEATDKLYDQMAPASDDAVGMIVREPLGVVGCVLPWNFPLMMVAWKIGPALATGNSVIVKPAEQTSMTTLRLAELALEAGVPAGVLNVLPGLGPDVGEPLGRHEGVEAISFTGSTEIGRRFLEFSAQSNLKKIVLECGGKNPAVVLSDADNLDSVARHAVFSALWNMGQNCTANSRLIVHEKVKDTLLTCIEQQLTNWKTGDPLDPTNQLGAIISREQYDKILGYIATGKKEGGEILCGGKARKGKGLFIEPTVFDKITPDMTIAKEEIFGPVLAIMSVASDAEAIQVANDTCYGLQASLYTANVRKAHRYARALQAGTVSVNCYGEGDITTPFGGYKLSGFGGRDNSLMAHDQYTETKTIWIDTSDDPIDDTV
ncbi:aldehyde dehydrogenase [Pelagibius sp. Alg239-R121]|uniref:aldehyde dehydrogenase n=1 Tax=Pelagibius sp. Alg239-R121 TaxID=2993448 RepID=UPI0024A6B7C2|nr:aldehyde dehydrogenase [Pelagibius sp. Alg239-R121]